MQNPATDFVRSRHPNMSDAFVELIASDCVLFTAQSLRARVATMKWIGAEEVAIHKRADDQREEDKRRIEALHNASPEKKAKKHKR